MKTTKILLALLLAAVLLFGLAMPAMAITSSQINSSIWSFMGQQSLMRAFPVLFMTPLQLLWHFFTLGLRLVF